MTPPPRPPENGRPEGYGGFRDPGVRLNEPLAEGLAAHRPDKGVALLPAIHDFDRAHLLALVESGWLDVSEAATLLSALEEAAAEGVVESRRQAGGGIHSGEYLLVGALGEPEGGAVSLGRSSADLGAVALRTTERARLLDLADALVELRAALSASAAEHLTTVMPLFAQGRHAQVTTVAHYLAAWGYVLERDTDRALVTLGRVDQSPAGAAIGSGSPFVTDRDRTAARLGFAAAIPNTLDAVTSFDHVLDVLSTLAILSDDLARLVDDLMGWSAPHVGYLVIPDRFSGTSSILAQARNPYAPQYVKGVAAAAAGALVNGLVVDRAGTGEAVLDRHQLSEQLMSVFGQTIRNIGWLTELVPALEWDEARLTNSVREGWAAATDLAGMLVSRAGLSWRSAHQVIGIAVRLAEERDLAPADLTPALLAEADGLYRERLEALAPGAGRADPASVPSLDGITQVDIDGALDPLAAVEARDLVGGPAPSRVTAQLAALDERTEADREVVAEHRVRLEAAAGALDAAVDELRRE